jgi:broad specificity phosphatase PhoE
VLLLLARHGQTGLNADGRLAGRLDVPLTELGGEQARSLAAAITARGTPTRVLSSPLLRARQTASELGRPVEVDDRWIELDYGDYDGARLDEVPGEVWDAWRRDAGFAPPGGESLRAVGVRVRAACDELARLSAPDDVVAVFSHVSPIKAAVAWALGVDDASSWRMYLAPGSLTVVSVGPRGPSLIAFNHTP